MQLQSTSKQKTPICIVLERIIPYTHRDATRIVFSYCQPLIFFGRARHLVQVPRFSMVFALALGQCSARLNSAGVMLCTAGQHLHLPVLDLIHPSVYYNMKFPRTQNEAASVEPFGIRNTCIHDEVWVVRK